MTTTATEAPSCPKCGGQMWDQKAGKFPYKEGTPIFKCKDKECGSNGGVIWEPKGGAKPAAAPKPPVQYKANVPEAALPPLLRNAEQEDAADLAAKLGGTDVLAALRTRLAVYQALTEFVLRDIAPIYEKYKVGMSPESSAACVQTLFIDTKGR